MPDSEARTHTAEFVRLLAAHEHCLSRFVVALVPNWSDAEDIIQQTKLRLWEQYDNYDPNKSFGVWACVIARYEVLAYRTRSARSRVQFSQQFIERVSDELTAHEAKPDVRLSLLEGCVRKLSEWQRDLLWRCCLGDDSTAAAASQLGRTVESTRKALLRIRVKLYQCVELSRSAEAD